MFQDFRQLSRFVERCVEPVFFERDVDDMSAFLTDAPYWAASDAADGCIGLLVARPTGPVPVDE